jgi:transcriptional repressor NrdR
MNCIYCGGKTRVTNKRDFADGVRRRRECLKCKKRFTTLEKVAEIKLYVIKKDGRREKFSREKLSAGIEKAFEKRPIPQEKIQKMINEVEKQLIERGKNEVKSSTIGEIVMRKMKKIDHVAYIRFASVYREFKDVKDFKKLIKEV